MRTFSYRGRSNAKRDRATTDRRRWAANLEQLEPRLVLAGDPVLNEFMASNDTTLADGDGDFSDWIEIYNRGDAPIDMEGWHLTDNASSLTKWEFPSAVVEPGGYLIVFASEKNPAPPGELHANFKLSSQGEYLALVMPDGETIATEYTSYPLQIPDVSYGLGVDFNSSTLVAADGNVRTHVPNGTTGQALATDWTEANYTLGQHGESWSAPSPGGVGYDLAGDYDSLIGTEVEAALHNVNSGAYVRSEFNVADPSQVNALSLDVQYDDGFVAYLNGVEVASRNVRSTASSPADGLVSYWDFDGNLQDKASGYTNNSGTAEDNLTTLGGATRFTAGVSGQAIAIGDQAGDAVSLSAPFSADVQLPATYTIEAWIKPSELQQVWQRLVLNWSAAEPSYHFSIRTTADLVNAVSLFHRDATNQEFVTDGGTVVLNQWQHVAGVANGTDLIVYLNGEEVARTAYTGTIQTATTEGIGIGDSVGSADPVLGFNGLMDELAIWKKALSADELKSHYEASALGYGLTPTNASGAVAWNSVALSDRADAVAPETIDLSQHVGLLQAGANVLAIHGLNSSAADNDFLVRAQLTGAEVSVVPALRRYYADATPGAANGTAAADLGPIIDSVAHEFLPPTGITSETLLAANAPAQYLVPNGATGPALATDWTADDYVLGSSGETWTAATGGFGFDDDGAFAGQFNTNLASAMQSINSSAYMRYVFDVADPGLLNDLTLRMKYDDGFIVYLNGQEIARRNANVSFPASPVAVYRFDDSSGAVAADEVRGAAGEASLFGGAQWTSGRLGGGIELDGVNDWLRAINPIANGATAMSFSGWVLADSLPTWASIVKNWGTTQAGAFHLGIDAGVPVGSLSNYLTDGTRATQGSLFPTGSWQHVALTYDGAIQRIYVNGVQVASAAAPASINWTGAQQTTGVGVVGIGVKTNDDGSAASGGAPGFWDGKFDDFAFWNTTLSPAQVADVYQQSLDGVQWNSAASASHGDATAVQFEEIDVSAFLDLLKSTGNVLSIHALNRTAADGDFLIVPELVAQTGSDDVGPLKVTARILPTVDSIDSATLHYRAMFGAEIPRLMVDDGTGGDDFAGDGIYTALVPGGAIAPSEMIRYYVTASDAVDVSTRAPLFLDSVGENQSAEFFGAVFEDPAVSSALPVLHRFIENPTLANTFSGTRGSVYFDGEFYDNVFIRIRGGTARTYAKTSYKIEFNDDHHFQFDDALPRVDEFNLNTTFTDKSYVRAILAYELHRDAGSPAPITFAMRVQENGDFFSVAHFVEQPDRDFLRRNGLDSDGALYKGNHMPLHPLIGPANNGGLEKKTRQDEGYADIQALIDGLALTGAAREAFLKDNVDLPAVVNFMAVDVILQNIDATDKNYYVYRDTEGTGLWRILPWDLDLTYGPNALNTDVIVAQDDSAPGNVSHPFLGTATFPYFGRQNQLFTAIIDTPSTRNMFLRRVRSLMDQFLRPTGTPFEELYFENRINELVAEISPDAALDNAAWGAGAHFGGAINTIEQAAGRIISEYLAPRRTHLYQTHLVGSPGGVGIPFAQSNSPTIQFGAFEQNPPSGNQDEEYIQLINNSGVAVDLTGWQLTGGVSHTFKSGTVVPAGASLYLTPNEAVFRARSTGPSSGQNLFIQGDYSGHLDNFGETISLVAPDDSVIDSFQTTFTPSDLQQFLRVTEVHYNPAGDDATEFIELKNVSTTTTLDLNGVVITNGPSSPFAFSTSAVTSLAPGEFVLVVKDSVAFLAAYPSVNPALVAGEFSGSLANEGERIKIEDAQGSTILDFNYEDGNSLEEADWPPEADGDGFSLVVVDELAVRDDWSLGSGWKSSAVIGGSPGVDDPPRLPGDFDGDGVTTRRDLVRVVSHFSQATGAQRFDGDANGDHAVTLVDLALVQRGAALSATPSPTAADAALAAEPAESSARLTARRNSVHRRAAAPIDSSPILSATRGSDPADRLGRLRSARRSLGRLFAPAIDEILRDAE